jgi:dihydrolipoamide dehydrogenase
VWAIVGPMVGELITKAVLGVEFSASTEDQQRTVHALPSLAETMHEAALAVDSKTRNFRNK